MPKGLQIEFHGVRGSIAAPGVATNDVGGNTSCVEITAGDTRIVLDAGTGLRTVGDRLVKAGPSETHILLSHVHWDHIQGFPFFVPLYVPGHRINVMSGPNGFMSLEEVLRKQMSPPVFPVPLEAVRQQVAIRDLRDGERFRVGDASVTVGKLNHPDPVYAYRIDYEGRSVVYATDTEHFAVVDPSLIKLCAGADVLIYDAMYTPEEYPSRVGWGHSTYEAGAALVAAAGVETLVLFHHDPARSDDEVAAIEERARQLHPSTVAAREGLRIELASRQRRPSLDGEEACAA